MPFGLGFVEKIKSAWGYIESAVSSGLDRAGSFVQYVSGGGEVDRTDWFRGYDVVKEGETGWDRLPYVPKSYVVGEQFANESPFDWRQQYVMKMKLSVKDLQTGEFSERWVTVESDELMTMEEWEYYGAESGLQGLEGSEFETMDFLEYEFFQRSEVLGGSLRSIT